MRIKTERTLLRPFEARDLDDLYDILGDSLVMKQTEPAYTKEKTQAFLMDFCVARKQTLAVCLKDGGKVVGYLLCSDRLEKDVYELGWIFNRLHWRHGLAYEAVSALIKHLFLYTEAHKVFAEAIDEVKSVPMMRKLGMRREGIQIKQTRDNAGTWRDMHLYGLLREDYSLSTK